ncbi:MAG: hypothetical protein STSR0008_18350 [Ignavibacterium sp.]
MRVLGNPLGIFDLKDSNHSVGSYLKKEDIVLILNIGINSLNNLEFKSINGLEVIDERLLQRAWYNGEIIGAPNPRNGNVKISLDELLLYHLIKLAYPLSEIKVQIPWGRKRIDFYIKNEMKELFIEFHGPNHFAPSVYPKSLDHPFIRKENIEKDFKIECVIWPYWIQRCEKNVKAIFENDIKGLGALWSTNTHFGMFPFSDSAFIINSITDRFNARRQNSVGYFYGPETENRNNPVHPIINEILEGKKDKGFLLPKGFKDEKEWLPNSLF